MQALTDVDFEVRAGEVMALVGDNGAGKTTLIKCIAGIHGMDDGEMLFDGEPVSVSGPKDAAKLGIEVVYQDLALCDNLDVVQNMYLGREANRFEILQEPPMEAKTRETLASLRVTTIRSIRQAVATLSGGQRQSVAVARAVMWNSRLVILDEPTAALGVAQTEQVLALVNRLAEQGLGVVLISHNLHDMFEAATQDRRPAPRPERRHLRAVEDDAAGGRARDHGGTADQGGGHRLDVRRERPSSGRRRDSRRRDARGRVALAAAEGQLQVRQPRQLAGHPRALDRRRRLLADGAELRNAGELHEPHHADGGRRACSRTASSSSSSSARSTSRSRSSAGSREWSSPSCRIRREPT